ncbi:MAG: preprotein translocase subunit YajC [Microbacteriaceae bacterium]
MDATTIVMLVVLAVLVFFMWRSSRKRKQQAEDLALKMVPGAEVMTNYGLYGTIVAIDETANTAQLEIAPGVVITTHRQTLSKTVGGEGVEDGAPRSVEEAMEIANREAAEREAAEQEALATKVDEDVAPEFGERVPESKKPARRTRKPTGDAS